ncbi:MAG: bifunctional adenosylcobinamide kinase/adenosylcobinamide-phosphate guanylyltransferase [Solirubrobacteraceae bacterium MAG38_C4-C5]|nr:bifunctional adenosylcobinamide kinase/adenosylcobinamide-phosphate guanylyltransferase [Candidatus Siliceabacter maunaloa]
MPLTLLLGGARSGKSTLAVRRASCSGAPVVFLATGEAGDDEMAARIARHRAERPARWTTVEEPVDLAGALAACPAEACVVVDCLSLWASNAMGRGFDDGEIERLAEETAGLAAGRGALTIAVSNEVGMGVVPDHPLGRRYRDVLGRVNALWAAAATEALLVVAGRGLRLEEDGG